MMYYIESNSNYECTEGVSENMGEFDTLEQALIEFLHLAFDPDSIDFGKLDAQLDEWMQADDWKNDIYYGGYYGGSICVKAVNEDEDERIVCIAERTRDAETREVTLEKIDISDEYCDATEEETQIIKGIIPLNLRKA